MNKKICKKDEKQQQQQQQYNKQRKKEKQKENNIPGVDMDCWSATQHISYLDILTDLKLLPEGMKMEPNETWH